MSVSVDMTKAMIFDLTCPEEKAFSLFEVINTCEGPTLPSNKPGYGKPVEGPYGEPEKY